jgi:hypothetical protein
MPRGVEIPGGGGCGLAEGLLPEKIRLKLNKQFSECLEADADGYLNFAPDAGEDELAFLRRALAAWHQRPHSAEPLYELARFCRKRQMYDESAVFAEAGLALRTPAAPALEDLVYAAGLNQELSIAAKYSSDPLRKDRGFAACNWLALNIPASTRNPAMSGLHFYLLPANVTMPSFAARPVGFTAPNGYRAMNPSIARWGEQIVMAQRTVNYTLDHSRPELDMRRFVVARGAPVHTRNFLLRLNADLSIQSSAEILPPDDFPEPAYRVALGFEDLRLFAWHDGLWCCAGLRELTPEGWCQQVLGRIDESTPAACRLTDWRVLSPEGCHARNWMPRVTGEMLSFISLCDPTRVLDQDGGAIAETTPSIVADQFRGGSQAIPFDGGSLALIHEANVRDGQRQYWHRFVWFDAATKLQRVSRPFFFSKHHNLLFFNYRIEFAAGLAWHPDGQHLVISYGVEDTQSWIATVDAGDVRRVLDDIERLAWSEPETAGRDARQPRLASCAKPSENPKPCVTALSAVPSAAAVTRTAPLIFIHSAPRTSSTWFWAKLRDLPSTCCYYEPFNEELEWLSRDRAATIGAATWDSHHPPTDPYYLEYIPLLRKSGGARLFDSAMTLQWFMPLGGLRGDLRKSEKKYLALLLRHADRAGKLPVFGFTRTLGRLWPIKNSFGGFHIFLHRNLWKQWISFLYYKQRDAPTYTNMVLDTVSGGDNDDAFFLYLSDYYLTRAIETTARSIGTEHHQSPTRRRYATHPRDGVKGYLLESLPIHDIFSMFMAMHIYLYLHAWISADLTIDVTKVARDAGYRSDVEQELRRQTHSPILLSDVADASRLGEVDVDVAKIDWDAIREHAGVAADKLAKLADRAQLIAGAAEFVDAAFEEMRRDEANLSKTRYRDPSRTLA